MIWRALKAPPGLACEAQLSVKAVRLGTQTTFWGGVQVTPMPHTLAVSVAIICEPSGREKRLSGLAACVS